MKELDNKEIREFVVGKCVENVQVNVEGNVQQALKWSRFLGELYNYEIVNRKRLADILESKLLFCTELSN